MSIITIQCRVCASEETRRYLWQLMAEKNTPLINQLLQATSQHPDFLAWQKKGKVPVKSIRDLCESLKKDSHFADQPGRFYTSAIARVKGIYDSWFAAQKQQRRSLEGKKHWLNVIKSESELIALGDFPPETIRSQAQQILTQSVDTETQQTIPRLNVIGQLLNLFDQTEDPLNRLAIIHLLKHDGKVSDKELDPRKFAARLHKKQTAIERLEAQLNCRTPQVSDLSDDAFLEALTIATSLPSDGDTQTLLNWEEQILSQLPNLTRKPRLLPYSIQYEAGEDLYWSKNDKGRICVRFSGLGKHTFTIHCDGRQLHFFQQFLSDWQLFKENRQQYSSGLFLLRSASLCWQEDANAVNRNKRIQKRKCKQAAKNGTVIESTPNTAKEPWNYYRLSLHCQIDTRLLTAQGAQQVQMEKQSEVAKKVQHFQANDQLTPTQQQRARSLRSTLERLDNPLPRPCRPVYQEYSHIVIGVSFDLRELVTVTVVNVITGKVLTCQNTRQLLTDQNVRHQKGKQTLRQLRLRQYRLLSRYKQKLEKDHSQRRKDQKRKIYCRSSVADLGQYLDRLLAKRIIALALEYRAGSIVLPELKGLRENWESTIEAVASAKCPNSEEAKRKYAKAFRRRIRFQHKSYDRLIQSLQSRAAKDSMTIEYAQQNSYGTLSETAQNLALTAYQLRQISL